MFVWMGRSTGLLRWLAVVVVGCCCCFVDAFVMWTSAKVRFLKGNVRVLFNVSSCDCRRVIVAMDDGEGRGLDCRSRWKVWILN